MAGGTSPGSRSYSATSGRDAQVKAFRLMVNRSVTWAEWDDELLSLELQELDAADFDLSSLGSTRES